jgi:hypothetical protein
MQIMTHYRWAKIAAEKWSSFRPQQGLASLDQFLNTKSENMGGVPD